MPEKVSKLLKNLESGFLGFWVKQYKVSFLFTFLIVIMGAFSFFNIGKDSSPALDLGIISVVTPYPGVNPADVDSLITEKIEREIKDIKGIKKITSDSTLGVSSIKVELNNDAVVRNVMSDISDKVDTINFPSDAEDTTVTEINSEDNTLFSVLLYSELLGKKGLLSESHQIKNFLEDKPGINKVTISGGNDYEIKILLDKDKIKALGLSASDISSVIKDFNKNSPIGNFANGDLNYDYRFVGEIKDAKELFNIPIKSNGSSIIYLKDIASVEKSFKNDTAEVSGKYKGTFGESIKLIVEKKSGADVFDSAEKAKKSVKEELSKVIYKDINYLIVDDSSEIISQSYNDLFSNIKSTFFLVFLTLFIFIGLKEGIISLIIVPMAYMITFTVLNLIGLSLNFMTNFSLILSLGVAIDTIIVIIEGANKKLKLGYDSKSAILLAGKEYKAPIISGTLTTLAAFIPLLTLPGTMGKYLGYIPITVFITLLASLFLTLTITSPIFWKLSKNLDYYRKDEKEEQALNDDARALLEIEREGKREKIGSHSSIRDTIFGKISSFYYEKLKKTVSTRFRRLLIIFTPIILLITSFITLSIPFTVFPSSDNTAVTVNVEAKQGTDERKMEDYIPTLEKISQSQPEVKNYTISISDNIITSNIELFSKNYREKNGLRDSFKVEKAIRKELQKLPIEEVKATVSVLAGGPPGGTEVGIDLVANSSNNIPTLIRVAKEFEKELKSIEGTKNVSISGKDTPGQIEFKLDREKLSTLGLSVGAVTGEIYAKTNGLKSGTIKGLYDDYDIVVKIADYDKDLTPTDIENIKINTPSGEILVGEIVDYNANESIAKVSRKNNKITLTVSSSTLDGYYSSDVQPKLIKIAEGYDFPEGITYASAGESEENAELIQSVTMGFFITLFLIFMILVFQFNSYGQPAIVLYSVILALLGVNTGLYILDVPYSMAFGIGFVALTGIVVNNAIVYIDKININLSEGLDKMEAVIEAGKSRLIPMLVTTITTIFGILPIALQDKFWLGLGATIIFGLIAGTFMTLFVIPALYYESFLSDEYKITKKIKRIFKRKKLGLRKKLIK